jgi:hypothetical protein
MFFGRPVRLGHRYCLVERPLDLTDAELAFTGEAFIAAVSRLDDEGWNRDRRIGRTTWSRMSLDIAIRRDDILELALTSLPKEEVVRRAEIIKEESHRDFESLPEFLRLGRYDTSHIRQPSTPLHTLYLHCMRFGYLSNNLLLLRVLVKKADGDPRNLVDTALELFKDVLSLVNRRELTRDFQVDLSWILTAHGLRAAAIMAVELLKQEQCPSLAITKPLPRSEIIQDLSVFASCLGFVDPSDGNFALCDQGQKIIKRILDRILSPPPRQNHANALDQSQPAVADGLDEVLGIANSSNLDFDTSLSLANDADFIQWLENMDWDKNAWTNFP